MRKYKVFRYILKLTQLQQFFESLQCLDLVGLVQADSELFATLIHVLWLLNSLFIRYTNALLLNSNIVHKQEQDILSIFCKLQSFVKSFLKFKSVHLFLPKEFAN